MPDEIIDRLAVEITANNKSYNTSLDSSIAKTKAMIIQQKSLTENLNKNQTAQEKTASKILKASKRYGENSAEVQKLKDKIATLKSAESQLTSELDKVNNSLKGQQQQLDRTTNSGRNMSNVFKALITGYAGKTFLEATIGGLAQFEQYETSFSILLGDMEKGRAKLDEIQNMASITPFELKDLAEASQLLIGYGINADDIIPTLTKLGDLSQGNAEKLGRISLAYGQMVAKQKVTGEELRQMTEAQVPLLKALQETLGVTGEEYEQLQSKGLVSITDLNNAIDYLATGTGQFAGMMEKQSQTLTGLFSTAKDNIKTFARDIGVEAFGSLKKDFKGFMDEFDRMQDTGELSSIAKGWGGAFATITQTVTGTTLAMVKNREIVGLLITSYGALKIVQQVSIALEAYKTAVKTATTAQALLNATISANPFVLLIGVLATVVGGVLAFSNATDGATKKVKELNEETAKIKGDQYNFGSDKVSELQRIATYTIPEIEKLGNEIDSLGGYSELSAGKQQLLQEKIEDVNGTMGEEVVKIDEHTGRLIINTNELYNNIEALEKRAKAESAYQMLVQKEKEFMEFSLDYEKKKEELNKKNSEYQDEQNKLSELQNKNAGVYVGGVLKTLNATEKARKETEAMSEEYKAMQENIEAVRGKTEEMFKALGEDAPKPKNVSQNTKRNIVEPIKSEVAKGSKEVSNVLENAYKEQLQLAGKYLSEQKKAIDIEYNYQAKKINDNYSKRLKALNDDYNAEKNRVNNIIKELDREINAKRKAREQEKQDQQKELLTQQVSILQQRISFARSPEERAELEKELKRQQELLKDIQVEEEITGLEAQKVQHQDKLDKLAIEHEEELAYLQERKERQLEDLEEQKEKAIQSIEEATTVMKKKLADVYGVVDSETVATGQKFADVTVNSINSGFNLVATQAQNTIDNMLNQVENAISRLKRAISQAENARSSAKKSKKEKSNSYSDSRSFVAKNYITNGMTENQIGSMLTRQSDKFLYGRG